MRSKSGPGGTLYQYGLCELAQRQAVLLRKDKSPNRAIKSDRAKVVMTAGCISKNFDIPNYIYNSKEKQLGKSEFIHKKGPSNADSPYHQILLSQSTQKKLTTAPYGQE